MSVEQIGVLLLGFAAMVVDVGIGLRYSRMTEVGAAAEKAKGRDIDLEGAHRVGKMLLASGPIIFLVMMYVALVILKP